MTPVPVTLYSQVHQISRPEATYVWEETDWFFSPPAASETCGSQGACHRRLPPVPVEILAPPMSFIERGRLSVVTDREHGHPAELVANLARKGLHGFAMAKKRDTGPGLFDALPDPEPAPVLPPDTHGPETPLERGMTAIAAVHADEARELDQAAPVSPPAPPSAELVPRFSPSLARMREELRAEFPIEPREPMVQYLDLAVVMRRAIRFIDAQQFARAEAHLRSALEIAGLTCDGPEDERTSYG